MQRTWHSSPPSPADGVVSFLSIVQHNSLGSWDVFLSLMGSLSLLPSPPMIIALQDPPVRSGKLPLFSSWKCSHPPFKRPRMAFYVHPHLIDSTSILPVPSARLDLLSLDIFAPSGLFEFSFPKFRITNAYSTHQRSPPYRTIPPQELFPCISFPLLVLGDLNIHHPSSDPLRSYDPREMSVSHPYFSLASERGFSLMNQPGVYTYFPFTHSSRPSVLDLAFANSLLSPAFDKWDTPLPSTGSDHVPIVVSLCSPRFRLPNPSPNWAKTDWDTILPHLPSLVPPPPPPSCPVTVFEEWFDTHPTELGLSSRRIRPSPGLHRGPNPGGRPFSRPSTKPSTPPPERTSPPGTLTATPPCVQPADPTSPP